MTIRLDIPSHLRRRGSLAAAGIAALAALALAAGCGALPDKPSRAMLYDFGPGPSSAAPAPADKRELPLLALAEIDANARLDGTQILFRLAYADANELRPYAQSRWSQPPAQLLRERLRRELAADRTVLSPEESGSIARAGASRYPDTLRVTLEEFSQVFDAPGRSVGLVRVTATLSRGGADRQTLQRSFVASRPAPTADAAGGVRALSAASDALAAEIVAWVDAQATGTAGAPNPSARPGG